MEIIKKLKAFIKSIFVDAVAKEIEREPHNKQVDQFYKRADRFKERSADDNLIYTALEISAWIDKKTGDVVHYDTCVMRNPDNYLVELLKTIRKDSQRIDEVLSESKPEGKKMFSGRKEIPPLELGDKSKEEIEEILKQRNSDLLDD